MAKGDQRGPKDPWGLVSRQEEGVCIEAKEPVGHSVSAVVCVIWGGSKDFLCPTSEPWSYPVSFAYQTRWSALVWMGAADTMYATSSAGCVAGACFTRHLTA